MGADDWGRRRSEHGPPLHATITMPAMEEINLGGDAADGGGGGKYTRYLRSRIRYKCYSQKLSCAQTTAL